MPENFPLIGQKPGKKSQVREMFDSIAPKYDLLNRVLSMGIDRRWRAKTIRKLLSRQPNRVLDVATGTADLAIAAARGGVPEVVGIDIAERMLAIGREKVNQVGLNGKVELLEGDAEALPFADGTFDAAMVAFGVRNFENLVVGLSEIARVLAPGGQLLVLEFSRPGSFPVKQIYDFYSRFVLPRIGRTVSKDAGAYQYLPESIREFPDGDDFLRIMAECRFESAVADRLTFGISTLYTGFRSSAQ